MEQRCKYNVTLKECNDKWEEPCSGDDYRCELQNKHNNRYMTENKCRNLV